MKKKTVVDEASRKSLINVAAESWRFSRIFSRLLSKLDAGETQRYTNQYRFYIKQLEENLEAAGLKLVNVEGLPFDPGMAATPINIEDFGPDETLLVDQMVEPIILSPEGVVRTGSVMLRKAQL